MVRFYKLVTGNNMDENEMCRIGERIWNLVRMFNVREGFSRIQDTIPPKILHEPLKSGISKGGTVSERVFEAMLDEYYAYRGCTREGIPTREKLMELNLQP